MCIFVPEFVIAVVYVITVSNIIPVSIVQIPFKVIKVVLRIDASFDNCWFRFIFLDVRLYKSDKVITYIFYYGPTS